MTTSPGADPSITRWLESIAPDAAPAPVLEASRARIMATQQRRRSTAVLRNPFVGLGRGVSFVAAAGVVVLIVAMSLVRWSSQGIGGPGVSASPTVTATAGPTRAEYVARVAGICASASRELFSEVGGLQAYQQIGTGPGDVHVVSFENARTIANATIRGLDAALADLRALPAPAGDRAELDAAYVLLEPAIDIIRLMPAAADARDEARLANLIGERIDATHEKDRLVLDLEWQDLGRALQRCPAEIGA